MADSFNIDNQRIISLIRKKKGTSQAAAGSIASIREALACVPVRNNAVEETVDTNGLSRLRYPLAYKPWFGRLAGVFGAEPHPLEKNIELDQLGSFCWQLIDNDRSVRMIIDDFKAEFSLQEQEACESVSAFIRELGRRGIIAITAPRERP